MCLNICLKCLQFFEPPSPKRQKELLGPAVKFEQSNYTIYHTCSLLAIHIDVGGGGGHKGKKRVDDHVLPLGRRQKSH